VTAQGQGGLLDVAVSPEFASDQTIFLTYSVAGSGGSATRVASAQLNVTEQSLENVTVLYTAPFQGGGTHFGSRVVVAGQYLYVTLGDRGDKNFEDHIAQNTQNPYGSIIRLKRDGSIPVDNPFVNDPAVLDEIYSYGHRNPQGLAFRPGTTELWSSEHGEFQGDEINVVTAGGNYGWPEAHQACSYVTRRPFGVLPVERPDTVPPVYVWPCGTSGFPPAGMTFYDGDMFPAWQGSLLVGGLASRYLARFTVTEDGLVEADPLLREEGWRVRDVAISPRDGAVYVAVEGGEVSLVRIVTE
jgi:glucose/arabinose dehydrogenase